VSDDHDSVQMLQRSSQVGEMYKMMPPPVWDTTKLLPGQYLVRISTPPSLLACQPACVFLQPR
jgi:hypothetical protein